jgi:hypothetical protein
VAVIHDDYRVADEQSASYGASVVDADTAERFREILTAAARDAGVTSPAAAFAGDGGDGGVWFHILVRAHPDVPFVAWLLDQGLALPRPDGVVLPVRCTEMAAHAFARQLLARADAAGQPLASAAAWPGEHPDGAYLRQLFGDQDASA